LVHGAPDFALVAAAAPVSVFAIDPNIRTMAVIEMMTLRTFTAESDR
jgi:hypothetical protein